ncbi:diaminopimelate decarboxylase [Chloroflexota bacterium]
MSAIQGLECILPDTALVTASGHLAIGGCDLVQLADEFGTPLYVFDEATLRATCVEFRREFEGRYPDVLVIYAGKAFLNRTLLQIFRDEGLGLDVVSGGELSIARSADFPLQRVYFHGSNKTAVELELALSLGVERVVIDNFYELSLLSEMTMQKGMTQDVLLRVCPGIDVHTHQYMTTGILDSKFGFPITTGQATQALIYASSSPRLNLLGLHLHLGSQIFDVEPYRQAVEAIYQLAAEWKERHAFLLSEFSIGGGFALPYTRSEEAPAIADYAEAITSTMLALGKELGMEPHKLVVEPGRAIVGRAGVAVYRAGAIKNIPDVCRYVSIDGGIGDNIRPALYGARYDALAANRMNEEARQQITIAGRFCESGDILARDIELPPVLPGDIIVIPVSGAYQLAMASNYNAVPRPAVVLASGGRARLIRHRETYQDLFECDLV